MHAQDFMVHHLIVGQTADPTTDPTTPTTDPTTPTTDPSTDPTTPTSPTDPTTDPSTTPTDPLDPVPKEPEQPAEPEVPPPPFYTIIDTEYFRIGFMIAAIIGAELVMLLSYLFYEFLKYWFKAANF